MSSHYFINDPNLKSKLKKIAINSNGISYRFYTDSGVFSKDRVDYGSLLLIETFKTEKEEGTFLDLGCGYGPIGIMFKKTHPKWEVHQTDINEKAIALTIENNNLNNVNNKCYLSDGFNKINDEFNVILLNPPIRAGKKVVFSLYDSCYENLKIDGELWVVIRKNQGALSHLNYLEKIFNNGLIVTKSKGFYVLKIKKEEKA